MPSGPVNTAPGSRPQGRAAQLEAIRRALDAAERGQPVGVLVEGERGIGRSTVLAEMAELAAERGFAVARHGCDRPDRSHDHAVARRLLDALPSEYSPGSADRFEDAVDAVRADSPLLVEIDDLQWCDDSTLRLLSGLIRRTRGHGLVLLGAVRSGEGASAGRAAESLAELSARCLRVQLVGLGAERVRELVDASLTGPCDRSFLHAVMLATDGNPRLVGALLHELAARGAAADRNTADRLAHFAPEAAAEDAYARMRDLGPDTDVVAVAEAVAVLAENAELSATARLAGLPMPRVMAAVDLLAGCRLLRNEQPLAFRHGLTAAALVRFLPMGRAEELHSRAAEHLRETGAGDAAVAHHLMRTSPADRPWAGEVLHEAGRAALAAGHPRSAVALLRRALREPREPGQRARVLADLGRAEIQLDLGSAYEHLNLAVREPAEPGGYTEVATNLAAALVARRRAGEARELLDQGARQLADADAPLAVRLETHAMTTAIVELSSREELGRRFDQLAERGGQDPIAQRGLDTMRAIQECCRVGGSPQAALDLALAALAGARPLETADRFPFWINVSTLSRVEADDLARQYLDQGEAGAAQGDDRLGLAIALRVRCRLAYEAGRLDEAVAATHRAEALLIEIGSDESYPWLDDQALTYHALIDGGRTGEAAALLGVDLAAPARSPRAAEQGLAHGHLMLAAGEPESAAVMLLDYGRLLEAQNVLGGAFGLWRHLAVQALVAAGDVAQARLVAADALDRARRWGRPRAIGTALHGFAVAEGGEPGLAAFEEAERLLSGTIGRLALAQAVADHAVALRKAGRRDEALAKLRSALSLARECGAGPLAARAAVELESLGSEARPTAPGTPDAPQRTTATATPAPPPTPAQDAVAPGLRIRCFGGFRMWRGEAEVDCSAIRPKVRALLQLLAVHAARPMHREQLLEALWPDLGPQAGIRNLQVTVSQLRAFLEPATGRGSRHLLLRDGESYQISLLPDDVCDVREFELAVRAWRRLRADGAADHEAGAAALRAAQGWYGGDLLPEVGPAEWVVGERRRLRVLASEVTGALAQAELGLGRAHAASEAARHSLELDEYQDASWRVLIAAYREAGSTAAADQAQRQYDSMLLSLAD